MLDGIKALENIKQLVDNPKPSYWERLKDATNAMDESQKEYVMSQQPVINVYKSMMDAFNMFLFERFKDDFASVQTFQPLIDKYVDTVITTAQGYGKHTVELEEENKQLKKKLEELLHANGPQAS